jgi:uncharacterized membrane protein
MSAAPESRLRSLIAIGASVMLIGIALAASDNQQIGGWLTLAGLISLVYGLHRYGRSGPDEPIEFFGSDAP